ncbi:O-antigen ligase family protein [Aurantibacillus circumpalustris]|uniref:O-antigen ligase family protein n=1 Tax=Aurantibacillus circumpalustris TaxID=3036359 RepID=UPI00295BD4EF|nr:hypothetical protein [Aurantibacillus circumpalustris]
MHSLNHSIVLDRKTLVMVVFIYLSVFINSVVFFKEPVEFQFGYLVYLILLPTFFVRYGINRSLFFIFLTLLLVGMVNVFYGNNTAALFFKVFIGLSLSYFFYYYVVVEFDYNVEQLFQWYLKGCYIAALLGVFQFVSFQIGFEWGYWFGFILNKWGVIKGGMFGIRLNSIFAEPTHLATVLSAAFFVSFYNLLRKEVYFYTRFQSVVIIVVFILSFSGVGQFGVFVTLILLAVSFGLVRYIFIAIPVGIILFNVLYANVSEFRERLDGLTSLFAGEGFKLGKTHGSSFILYNNFVVATENFKQNFVFGTGIGSHPIAFEKYSIGKNIKVYGLNLNSADANSMLLRLISETGIFGIGIFVILIFKCYVRRNEHYDSYHWLVSNGILVMILLNLFRQGHYFLNGFPFFVILYYFNSVSYKLYLETSKDLYEQTLAEKDQEKLILPQL